MTATLAPEPTLAPGEQVGPFDDLQVHVQIAYYPEGAAVSRWDIAKWDVAGGGQWAGAAPLEDISCNVTSVKIARGHDDPLTRFRPATATVDVYDPEGRWSPWRTASAPTAYSTVRPGIDVFVWVDTGTGRVDRFAGIVDAIVDTFPEPSIDTSHMVTFQCFDYLSLLAAYDGVEQAAVGAGELAAGRLTRILNNAGYSGPRNFDNGTVALQATTLAKNALDESGIVCDTEMGYLWCDRSGMLQFRDRNGLGLDPHYTTVQATFGEEEPELCYVGIALSSDLAKIKNIVSVANVGGTSATVTDTASVSLYRPRTYKRTDLINVDGAQNAIIAQRYLDYFAYADNRVESLDVDLSILTHTQRLQVLALALLYRIQVRRRAEGFQVVADLQIQAVSETITPSSWTITYQTFSAAAVFAVGRWDRDTWDHGLWGY
jgi:hypothetical protein